MIYNDTTNRQGAIQEMEDICGLGATGISGNTTLFQQFTRWSNKWNLIAIKYAIRVQDGFDIDDPNWTTYPSGTYAGTIERSYMFSNTEKLLKLKKVGVTVDGVNYREAYPIDTNSTDYPHTVKPDAHIDQGFYDFRYDPKANGFDIYPKFTQAQVDAGAKVYVEFYRAARDLATTGTNDFILPFADLVTKGASYEYASLYNPSLAATLRTDIYGNNGNIPGVIKDMKIWYNSRYPHLTILENTKINSK